MQLRKGNWHKQPSGTIAANHFLIISTITAVSKNNKTRRIAEFGEWTCSLGYYPKRT
jgi:hypothetical protein